MRISFKEEDGRWIATDENCVLTSLIAHYIGLFSKYSAKKGYQPFSCEVHEEKISYCPLYRAVFH